jgi:hypothetical protein
MEDWACPLDERRAAPAASRLDTCGVNRDAAPKDEGAENPYAKVRQGGGPHTPHRVNTMMKLFH